MRTVIVTGASRGLGRSMALALAEDGMYVVAAGHLPEDAQALKDHAKQRGVDDRLDFFLADIRLSKDCDELVNFAKSRHGQVDALINNAGLTLTFLAPDLYRRDTPRRFFESSDKGIRGIYETNCIAAEMMACRVAPGMIAQGWGRIVNVTTMYATMKRPGFCPYGASNAALEMSTMVWAEELKDTGVTVNVLNPGGGANTPGIATEMREASARGEVPKLVEPDAMEKPICWLLSNASNGVTGMRFDAKTWNSALPADDAARSNAHPAGLQLLVGA